MPKLTKPYQIMPYSCVAHRPDPAVEYYEAYKNIGRKYTKTKASDNPNDVLTSAFGALTPTRTWEEKLLVKGVFNLKPSMVEIPSNILIEIQGRIYQPAPLSPPNHTALLVKDKTNVTIMGGEIAGLAGNPTNLIRVDKSNFVDIIGVNFKESFSAVLYWNECVGGCISYCLLQNQTNDGWSIEGCEGIDAFENEFQGNISDRYILLGLGAQNCEVYRNKIWHGTGAGAGISVLTSYAAAGINPTGRPTLDIRLHNNYIKNTPRCIELFAVMGHTANAERIFVEDNDLVPSSTGRGIHVYREAGSPVFVRHIRTKLNTILGGDIGIHMDGAGESSDLLDDIITSSTPIRINSSPLRITCLNTIEVISGSILFEKAQWQKALSPWTIGTTGSGYVWVYENGFDLSSGSTSGSSATMTQTGNPITFREPCFDSRLYLWETLQQTTQWGLYSDPSNYAIFYVDNTTVAGYFRYRLVTGGVTRGDANTDIPVDTGDHDFHIEARDDQTLFYIDGVQKASLAFGLPAGATPRFYIYNKEAVEKGLSAYRVGIREL